MQFPKTLGQIAYEGYQAEYRKQQEKLGSFFSILEWDGLLIEEKDKWNAAAGAIKAEIVWRLVEKI